MGSIFVAGVVAWWLNAAALWSSVFLFILLFFLMLEFEVITRARWQVAFKLLVACLIARIIWVSAEQITPILDPTNLYA